MNEDKEIAPDGAFVVDVSNLPEETKRTLLDELLKDRLDQSNTPEKIELLRKINLDANLSYAAQNVVNKHTLVDKKDQDSQDYTYPKYIAVANMIYMIDNGSTTDETLEQGRLKFNKSKDWLLKVRNKPIYGQSKVVTEVKKKRNKFFQDLASIPYYRKSMLTQADTPVSQLNHLNCLINILKIDQRLSALEERNTQLELIVEAQGNDIETIQEYIGISNEEKKPLAKLLKASGMTYKDISDNLGVSVRTLKYWNKSD